MFILGFKSLVCPIERLVANRDAVWDSQCTQALNHLAELILKHLRLGMVIEGVPLTLHLGEREGALHAIFT